MIPPACVRIVQKHKTKYSGVTECGDSVVCYLPGKMLREGTPSAELPAVGDVCRVSEFFLDESNQRAATITELLPRRSKISRMAAGTETCEQILSANVDYVFIVTSMNSDFSVNRLRRYILLAKSGNAQPIIVFSKCDLISARDLQNLILEIESTLPSVPHVSVSSISGTGLEAITDVLAEGQTGVFVGSSGVGKSTLVNRLLGRDEAKTTAVREDDDKGRHTTSGSGMYFLPGGGAIIDTAGLREVQILGDSEELVDMIPSVAELAVTCRFTDCTHKHEPGCAVQAALDEGSLSMDEFASYGKLQRELHFAKRKLDERLESAERKKWKRVAIEARRRNKAR